MLAGLIVLVNLQGGIRWERNEKVYGVRELGTFLCKIYLCKIKVMFYKNIFRSYIFFYYHFLFLWKISSKLMIISLKNEKMKQFGEK